nr:MAG TPA: hypothetical protein [Caudoviricetes sp.]
MITTTQLLLITILTTSKFSLIIINHLYKCVVYPNHTTNTLCLPITSTGSSTNITISIRFNNSFNNGSRSKP